MMPVLRLRRREEEEALGQLAEAGRVRADAEAEEALRVAAVGAARQRHDGARIPAGAGAVSSGAVAVGQARFVARRRDELARAEARLDKWRSGALADARMAEETARQKHLEARRAREALHKHEARFDASERRVAGRREEDAADDVAQATRHARGVRDARHEP